MNKLKKSRILPKQLKHWIKKAGLKFQWQPRNLYCDNASLVGYGFYWRIISHISLIERSCKIENFDRWANSLDYSIDIGSNEKEFLDRVNNLKSLKEVNP